MGVRLGLTLILGLAACGDDVDPASGDGGAADAAPADAARCDPAATADLGWLADYELEVVSKLAGGAEIAPGVTMTARATAEDRETTRVYLEAELRRWALEPAREAYATGANVVARLPATTGAADVVVLGAHFDGVPNGPAAADDGTGVALVLAAARHFAAVECREVELVFALFDEEEKGLIGSIAFAAGLVERREPVRAVHVFDMISFDGDRDGAAELWSPTPLLLERYQAAGAALGVPIRDVEFAFSDHQSFLEADLPTTGVSEEFVSGDATPHYHQPTDTVDNVDFGYLAAITRLAFAAIALDAAPP